MNFPSSNTDNANPALNDIVSNVESSHGVRLTGGSTGGIVTAVGDDANISLTVTAKGTGLTRVGNSSAKVVIGTSTSPLAAMQASLIEFTIPALSSAGTAGAQVDSTLTMTGATTNGVYIVQQRVAYNSTTDPAVYVTARCSTADELKLTIWNHGPSSLSGSTSSAYLLFFRF